MNIPTPQPTTTDAEIFLKFQAALAQKSTIKGAARVLGISAEAVRDFIEANPTLRAYLNNAAPPTEAELIAEPPALPALKRPGLPPPSLPGGEEEKAAALAKANAQLQSGLASIGVEGDELTEAVSMCGFAKLHFESLLHLSNGGMAKLFVSLMAEVKAVTNTINSGGDMEFEEEQMLREDRSALVKHLIDIANYNREAAVAAAKINQLKDPEAGKAKKRGKPGFAALEAKTDSATGVTQMRAVVSN